MFVRWKGKYAYLERRYLTDGKVKSKSAYLGQNPLKALAKMLAAGEISTIEYRKICAQHFEGTLKPTGDGGFGIFEGPCGLLKNTRVSIYFDGRWLACRIAKDDDRFHSESLMVWLGLSDRIRRNRELILFTSFNTNCVSVRYSKVTNQSNRMFNFVIIVFVSI